MKKLIVKKTAGAIKINRIWIEYQNDEVCLVLADLKSKYADISYHGMSTQGKVSTPMVGLGAAKHTLYINKRLRNYDTEIHFKSLIGWKIFASNVGRYTLSICFVKIQ